MEDYRVKFIKSLKNVLKDESISKEDRSNLVQCIGYIFLEMKSDGEITKELAQELDLEHLL